MKLVLIGYPGSQKIRKASEYLVQKYLPDFEVSWLNYDGEIAGWSKFVSDYLKTLGDDEIVFALDDYLISAPIGIDIYETSFLVTKLCFCTQQENKEYPVTTQYSIWDRRYLIKLLSQTTTPWDFEITGSKIFKQEGHKMNHLPILKYNVHSALSKRWEGINLEGLNKEDLIEVTKLI